MATVSIVILPILLISLLATFFVVVFVARDASKRNMSALAWALVAALTPFFLGLIIYLICRKPIVDLQCPKCGAGISQYDRSCPNCGQTILTQCPQCDFPVQKGWNTCPSCGTEFPQDYGRPVRNYKKDNGMIGLIIVVVLALLTLFVAVYVLFGMNYSNLEYENVVGSGGFEGMYNITAEDMAENQAITEWLEECKNSNEKVYVIVSDSSDTVILYVPNSKNLMECEGSIENVESSEGTKQCYLYFYVEDSGYENNYGYDFFLFECEEKLSQDTIKDVYLNGEHCDAEVTFTDADISWESWRNGNGTE